MNVLVVYVTFPGREAAGSVAERLVEERLAACCNLLPGVESVYRWEGRVETAQECLMLAKTTAERFPALRDRVMELHPYDLPEVIAVPVTVGLEPYLGWVGESVSGDS